jgi:hypothetical protein
MNVITYVLYYVKASILGLRMDFIRFCKVVIWFLNYVNVYEVHNGLDLLIFNALKSKKFITYYLSVKVPIDQMFNNVA